MDGKDGVGFLTEQFRGRTLGRSSTVHTLVRQPLELLSGIDELDRMPEQA